MTDDTIDSERNQEFLDPTDLDLTDRDEVADLGDGRYLVASDGSEPDVPADADAVDPRGSVPTAGEQQLDVDAATEWVAESIRAADVEYGFDATVKVDGSVAHARSGSNDVVETFETLLSWYARQVDDDAPPAETLGILLAEADAEVTVPTAALRRAVARAGLSAEDSVGDLLAASGRENGLRLD